MELDEIIRKLKEKPFDGAHIPLPKKMGFNTQGTEWDLEIGAGAGLHAIQYAKLNPERNLIAIERTKNKFDKLKRRVENHPHLSNVYPVYDEGINWIFHNIKTGCIKRIFLLYPNPYPKNAQINKRWYGMPFMQYLIDILLPGGEIILASNIEEYINDAKYIFVKHFNLELLSDEIVSKDSSPRTHFERKYLLNNQVCRNCIFKK